MDQFDRTRKLIGEEAVNALAKSKIIVFGVGGVGGYICEALCRAGVGTIDIVDKDVVDETNINRQIIATHDTIGKSKVYVMKERMLSINPNIKCEAYRLLYGVDNKKENSSDDAIDTANKEAFKNGDFQRIIQDDIIEFDKYDYVIDAVDNVTAKIKIIEEAKKAGVNVISSMGTGNKLNPGLFKITDIEKTKVCPLAKVVRKELRDRGIKDVKVLYSEEEPVISSREPASISTVPSVAGLLIANEVIKDICGK